MLASNSYLLLQQKVIQCIANVLSRSADYVMGSYRLLFMQNYIYMDICMNISDHIIALPIIISNETYHETYFAEKS